MTADRAALAWDWPAPPTISPIDSGLINQTWLVACEGAPCAVLQRLNTRIFSPRVHEDIDAVTTHLAAKGLPTPRLVPTRSGALWSEAQGEVWRCETVVGDRTVDKLVAPSDARGAGALVARFHGALADLSWSFRSVRPGAHDTDAHMAGLAAAVEARPDHRLRDAVAPLAEELLARWAAWEGPRELPTRIVHGDLKISNVRFAGPEALALIDLDTLAWGALDVELGDALRSWCNPASEDAPEAAFDLDLFAAAVEGYASGADFLVEAEWRAIVPGVERVATELAARFAKDALEERYFGWNPRFGGRGEHNLLRARGQASLARKVGEARAVAEGIVARARRG